MRRLPPGRPLEAPGSPAFLPGAARPGVMAWVRLSPRCSRAPRRVGPPIPRDGRLASFLCSRAPRGMGSPIHAAHAWAAGVLASSSPTGTRSAEGCSRRLPGDSRGSRRDSRAAPGQAPGSAEWVATMSALRPSTPRTRPQRHGAGRAGLSAARPRATAKAAGSTGGLAMLVGRVAWDGRRVGRDLPARVNAQLGPPT